MAKTQQRDLVARLADAGEEAIKRLGELPGTGRMLDAANTLRDRVDELQRRMRGLDVLEKRVDALEKRLAKLEKAKPATRARASTTAKKKTS